MGATKENSRTRKADELCDYCYHNRVLSAEDRDLVGTRKHRNIEMELVCTCADMGLLCRDKNCRYYRNAS